ncbi:MAG: cysteine desulfurase [Gemmatimonadetes bacterium]|nr:cysteine desulfurase [Gemmatimonadota bacterium]
MQPIYLDHAATTPVRPAVRDAMLPWLGERFGNPSSSHRWGREARAALEDARERVAAVLGATRSEIFFTACGTESDNLAILGRLRAAPQPRAVVCSAIEHKAVLMAVAQAAREGARTAYLGVDREGRVEIEAVDESFALRPTVVSVMWGNNEVGSLQPVRAIAERCRSQGVIFHSDAVQAYGKTRIRVDEVPCDLVSLGAHKFGGPKGVGVLYVREGVQLEPLQFGGGQEGHLRPGTESVADAVGFATAAELAAAEQAQESPRLARLRDRIEQALRAAVPGIALNGAGADRLAHISNLSIPDVDQDALVVALDLAGIAVSVASACQSGAAQPSHVLTAMGRTLEGAATLRVSVGRTTTDEEAARAAREIPDVIRRVREAA